ncbi:MAG TPA: sigma-54-dependent Fis family transcriptional regulator, partial [Clostridiales bacterium]|nr:sigma-54-dependent Fis family transcriptional regulator [Clostridiales bacterium]
HNISLRKNGPFVTVNCAAMPENLLESELFGYEEGAFTGAKKGGRHGLFELAHNGTIFLDEVSELPLSLQGRLLRVLQEKEILRIGGDYILNVNIRVIAATNKNLLNMVNEGKFRQDLYYRLNVIDVIIPPLRERKEDIPDLANMFLDRMNDKYGTKISPVSDEIIKILTKYNWPGNVRQLENFIEKSAILSDGFSIDSMFVTNSLLSEENYFKKNMVCENVRNDNLNEDDSISVRLSSLSDIELQVIEQASKIYKGDKSDLANVLGISRSTLWKRLKQIEESYKS